MEYVFFIVAAIAVIATFRVVTNTNAVHALLYLIVSLLSVAMIFFMVGAPFAGIMEIVVYVGAIMVLFVFVIMMLNLGQESVAQERRWLKPGVWIGPTLLSSVLFVELLYALSKSGAHPAGAITVSAKQVGIALYGPYLLVVELASMLLLAALVAAYHLGRPERKDQ
ncbi:NADH-quinone oxidoreductase subunit J [Mangrovitalea sediminis]|uniref:NADH-quinone oxidoreductase subunit J n=1 Tax=Mangrovitalea sediminis TaxID=1982043 RepID=UPI000BE508B1|nr:NADH-quinone oxidoreductase subunit J [Mangrovitalea sediminis]